ncbi:Protein T16G1.9 [Aphelenchoides avenae]|nr:Protein T16G1.9 [Aphelenchus avenae]
MICDLSTGCEIMPPSLLMLFECACAGSAWNRSNGTHQLVSLLPAIAAEHLLLNGNLSKLLEQAAILGALEVELSKLGSPSSSSKDRLSVFVEIILNPENITLSSLTASIFKRGRMELQRTLDTLRQSQSQIPYNYNLALVFTEIQLVTELLSLICKHVASLPVQ